MSACAYPKCVESGTYRVQCRVEIPGTRLGSFRVDRLMLCGRHMRDAVDPVEWLTKQLRMDTTTTQQPRNEE